MVIFSGTIAALCDPAANAHVVPGGANWLHSYLILTTEKYGPL